MIKSRWLEDPSGSRRAPVAVILAPVLPIPRKRVMGFALLLLVAMGCGTYFPINRPLARWDPAQGYRASLVRSPNASDELALTVAMSGGGMRAAAFAYGVLEELAATSVEFDGAQRNLLDEIDAVTGVSGGSFTAAYFGLHGRGLFEDFEDRVLRRNMQVALLLRLLWPPNWVKLLSPYWARSDLAAEYYDETIFGGASFADLSIRKGPHVAIHATDLITGSPFTFTQEQFDYLCSDLSHYPISRAVAASSAVPLVLSPITLRNYRDCGFEPPRWVTRARRAASGVIDREHLNAKNLLTYLNPRRRYVRVVDGVVSDNLGVRGPFEAWLKRPVQEVQRDGSRQRWVVLLVVNTQTVPSTEWERAAVLPSLGVILDAATSAQVNRYNFETIELIRRTFALWNRNTLAWDPPLRFDVIETSFLDVADEQERRALNDMATSLYLPDRDVRRLRDAARKALRASPGFGALQGRLSAARPPAKR